MIEQNGGVEPAEREWTGWPAHIRQRALAIIATTRCEWTSHGNATPLTAAPEPARGMPAQFLFRIVQDAKSSRAGRVRRLRVRARRRARRRLAA